jgi:signal transduction histidine kinase
MTTRDLTISTLVVQSILYVVVCAIALRRGRLRDRGARALLLYAGVSALWIGEQLAWHSGWLDALQDGAHFPTGLSSYGLVLLALLFLHLTRVFLRRPGAGWPWFLLGIAWLGVLVVLDSGVWPLPATLRLPNGWGLSRSALIAGLTFAGWALLTIAAMVLTLRTARHTLLPLHRNRITYWWAAWAVTVGGDLLFFGEKAVLGGDVRLLGTVIAAYAVLTYRLPDVRKTVRRLLSYVIITLLTIVSYTAGFIIVQYFFQNVPGYDPLWAGAAVALVLAILFDPLLKLVQKVVNRLITGTQYDASHIVGEYSLRISNVVSLERLSTLVVEFINDALEIRHGLLLTVHHERDREGRGFYRLRGIRGAAGDEPVSRILSEASPVTHHLREERRPLTQYDIDLLPSFQSAPPVERTWLSSLNMDIYVPVLSQGSWIGLLALGSKTSGDPYFDEDLALLSTLADQTAVALENARLVSDLIEINHDLEQAYAELARANRQLQEMDRLKSAFIGVVTHELRSPLANIAFSLQLFQQHGVENLTSGQREQLEQLLANLRQARAMIDNLVTFATFLSKQGELNLGEVDFRQMIDDVLLPLRPLAEARSLKLRTQVPPDLPLLRADGERLSDAVHHLVHNAIKFTGPGGEIWTRCRTTDGALHFEVKDTGVGIPPDRLPALWEEFAQMADPLQRGVEGLGLGLALVKYVVTAHGGTVWAESQEGLGSTFGFEIPLPGRGGPA